uniref:Uncharacterized protein n=1 Tax=Strombidium inclinatum TaxID=197538 RepID=A0A7S3MYX2_9SPIT
MFPPVKVSFEKLLEPLGFVADAGRRAVVVFLEQYFLEFFLLLLDELSFRKFCRLGDQTRVDLLEGILLVAVHSRHHLLGADHHLSRGVGVESIDLTVLNRVLLLSEVQQVHVFFSVFVHQPLVESNTAVLLSAEQVFLLHLLEFLLLLEAYFFFKHLLPHDIGP